MIVSVDQAVERLQNGEAVAIPTETVYGLAGSIHNPTAIQSIFSIKERPFFDPLIVHVHELKQVHELSEGFGPLCEALAQQFWPGPLTLVTPKKSTVSDVITSGLGTVGIRMPAHAVALDILQKVGVPLAAPSANKFGKTSPTEAKHVEAEFLGLVPVVDGGACEVGLESTVLWVSELTQEISVLRKGAILLSQIEQCLNKKAATFAIKESINSKESPGHTKHHYMPAVPFILVTGNIPQDFSKVLQDQIVRLPEKVEGVQIVRSRFENIKELKLSTEAALASREFYGKLRDLVQAGADGIVFQIPKDWSSKEAYAALLERMHKAASLKF